MPKVPTSTEAERAERAALKLVKAENRKATSERAEQALGWSELLRRVFRVDGWRCPHCAKPMKLRSNESMGPPARRGGGVAARRGRIARITIAVWVSFAGRGWVGFGRR